MKKIVVVEDFNTSRQIIKRTLEKLGYEVLEASDGREALKYFDGGKIDLLVSDYNMPNMDGAQLIEYVRSKEEYKYIPILMLSTETNVAKQNRAKEAKITAWIRKPFEIDEFAKIVDKALK
jgi:two-component system, chemotaxis family, chemotaxis protein CheY